jgi:flagellum-specific peptidoglycan hydrolase FlgJ
MNQKEFNFLQALEPAARASCAQTGVPASVTIAQAILESGWGESELAREANNFFGIKAEGGQPSIELPTQEFVDGHAETQIAAFARYATPAQGCTAHAELLARDPRYERAMAVKQDASAFCRALQICGYSTNPKYAELLEELIREFDLTQYDPEPQR